MSEIGTDDAAYAAMLHQECLRIVRQHRGRQPTVSTAEVVRLSRAYVYGPDTGDEVPLSASEAEAEIARIVADNTDPSIHWRPEP